MWKNLKVICWTFRSLLIYNKKAKVNWVESNSMLNFQNADVSFVSLCSLHPSCTSFFWGVHHAGLSCSAGHVCSWRWRPCNANPPPRLRKVPCLPVQNQNNKELSVAAASRVQRTQQNMSKSHSLLLLPTHPSMRDSPSLSCFLRLTLFSTQTAI